MNEPKRKGARSTKDIPTEILIQLNQGKIETANLVEWLAVDQLILLENLLTAHQRLHYLPSIQTNIDNLKKKTVNTINETIGTTILTQTKQHKDEDFLKIVANHPADLVRCWATYTIGRDDNLNLQQKLEKIQFFAADTHFGVREISWLAIRHIIAINLEKSIEILSNWTSSPNENIRRFASEVTRPRGVWCEHLEILKVNPELGLPILTSLKADSSKYVQDSVANWLNDASKTRPDFVLGLCEQWQQESNTKSTLYIIKKALRTINK